MKRKTFLLLAVLVVACVLVLCAGAYYWHLKSRTTVAPSQSPSVSSSTAKCAESPEYFVIDNNPGVPGLDIAAKHKTSPNEIIPCNDMVGSGDFTIQNGLPEYFLAVTQNFLVLDEGTAPPPRVFEVYNLDTRKSIYKGSYFPPVSVASGTITYWKPVDMTPTQENCPSIKEYETDGLGVVMESHVVLDLSTLAARTLGEYRCGATQ